MSTGEKAALAVPQTSTPPIVPANPLGKYSVIGLLTALVSVTCIVAIIVCAKLPEAGTGADQGRRHLLLILLLITMAGWFAFAYSKNTEHFVRTLALSLLVFCMNAWLLSPSWPNREVAFWLSLIGWVFATIVLLVHRQNYISILNALIGAWSVATLFVTIGANPFFKFSEPALQISEVRFLRDLRVLLGLVATAALFVIALCRALTREMPSPPSIPGFRTTHGSSDLFSYVIQITSAVCNVILIPINLIWQLLAILCIYIKRLVDELVDQVKSILRTKVLIQTIGRIAATMVMAIAFAYWYEGVVRDAYVYLRHDVSFLSFHLSSYTTLSKFVFVFLLLFLAIVLLGRIHSIGQSVHVQGAVAGTVIVIAWWLSGLIMFGLSRLELVATTGFESFGLFSFAFTLAMVLILCATLLRRHQQLL